MSNNYSDKGFVNLSLCPSLAFLFVLTYFALLLLDKLMGKIYTPVLNRLLTMCHL